ncbi:F0F1 ATP synthase subunit B family protein [Acetobacter conturbans]|uniref:F0F1 ATP synthase subunit B family protein n=1 Tax=Acetobacter conturbans TaxID=1737472 RepID=UPI001568276F
MNIDWWTLGFQLVNLGILIWLLGRFFWRPLSAIIAGRQNDVARRLDALAEKEKQVEAERVALSAARTGIAGERAEVLRKADVEAQAGRVATLSRAQQDAAALQEATRQTLAREETETRTAWGDQAASLAVDIARQILSATGISSEAVRDTLFARLEQAVTALPLRERTQLQAGFILMAAVAPEDADRRKYETRLAGILGTQPVITWTTDPTLIEGFAVITPSLSVASSWKADLDHIRDNLTHARS